MSLAISRSLGKSVTTIQQEVAELMRSVRSSVNSGESLDAVEREVWNRVLGIGRQVIDVFLAAQGDGDLGKTLEVEGETLHRSEATHPRRLRSVFGEHHIDQYCYSPGLRRKITFRPIDVRCQLPHGVLTQFMCEISAMFSVDQAFGLATKNLGTIFGGNFSVNTLEQNIQGMGEIAGEYLGNLPIPAKRDEGELLVASCDGKGVPLIRGEAEPVAAFEGKKVRPGNRRMAMLGAVYSVDRYVRSPDEIVSALFRDPREAHEAPAPRRPLPRFKHVSAHFAEEHPEWTDAEEAVTIPGSLVAMCWVAKEILPRRQPKQPLIILMDGQASLWKDAANCLEEAGETTEILDILHVSQYLWDAAKVFEADETQRKSFMRPRLKAVLEGRAASVIRGFRRMASVQRLKGDSLQEINRICEYLQTHLSRMKYDEYLAAGYPIATGVIEGACRHLVKDRMERSGMRWSLTGARTMLNVRAVFQSDYWEDFQQKRIHKEQLPYERYRPFLQQYKPLALAI